MWIIPPKAGLPRLHGSHKYEEAQRYKNKFLNIASSQDGNSPYQKSIKMLIFMQTEFR